MSNKDLKRWMASMAMSKEEIEKFLSVPRIARMATINNGKPHVVPVWYYYDGTSINVTVTKDTRKAKNLKKNPNASIAIDVIEGEPEDISFLNGKAVIIEGVAEMRDDIDGSFARRMYERYVGKNALNTPMVQFSINMPRQVLVIRPMKIMSWDISKLSNREL
jgi:nitroimidazol reductase NimA-like FMN-containing flavoprotein (pyridoxamine 5'-phosphate oxidase superfamily)